MLYRRPIPMRCFALSLVVTLAALAAGCPSASSELNAVPGDDDSDPNQGSGSGSGAPGTAACAVDEDCVAAGATCCACPTFATRADDPRAAACSDVDCGGGGSGGETCNNNVRAACDNGACVLACLPTTCSNACPDGYARDANGCLTCECAVPANECTENAGCSRIAADCCGCARGGSDIAVPAGTEEGYGDSLGCSDEAACPEVDTCVAGDAPQCIQGTCALGGPLPGNACGRPDLPACGACMVNANDQANLHGVGICP